VHAEASGDEQERARSADALCTALLYGPAPVGDAAGRAEAILASAAGNIVLEAHVSTSLAGLVAMEGDFGRARALYGEAGAVYEKLGLRLPRIGWTVVVAAVELLACEPEAALSALRTGYEMLDEGGYDSLRAYQAALLALVLAAEGRAAEAQLFVRVCERAPSPSDRDTNARLLAANALLVSDQDEAERLAHEAVAVADETDDLNLRGAVRLTLARVTSNPAAAAEACALFEKKGNVAAAAAAGLWSLQT
jgi:hypothetical protein